MALDQKIYELRKEKLKQIEALGQLAYPYRYESTHTIPQILADYTSPEGDKMRRVLVAAAHVDLVNGVIDAVERAAARKADLADAYRARGLARRLLGNYAGAVDDYTRALELEPDSSVNNWARTACRTGSAWRSRPK